MQNTALDPARAARTASEVDADYSAFLDRLPAKARAAMLRHDEIIEAANDTHTRDVWRRLTTALGKLAPFGPDTLGKQALRFYIPDGKYRQQVFALENTKTGILVFLPDILAAALKAGVITPGPSEHLYVSVAHPDATLRIEVISTESPDLLTVKPMLGWGRRALRATLGPLSGPNHLDTLESLAALAAANFPVAPAPAEAQTPPPTP